MERSLREAADICSSLVKLQTPQESLDYLVDRLNEFENVSIKKISFAKEHPNLIINIFKNKKKKVIISGHVDVGQIGEEEDWKYDSFSGKILQHDNDLIVYGRGSSDMKGGITAVLMASKNLLEEGSKIDYNIFIVLTSDEEVGGYHGIRKLLDHIPLADFCIIPEPTSMLYYCIGEKGVIRGNLFGDPISLEEFKMLAEDIQRSLPQEIWKNYPPALLHILARSEKMFEALGSYEKLREFHVYHEHVTNDRSEISIEIPYLIEKTPLLECVNKLESRLNKNKFQFFEFIEPNITSPNALICKVLERTAGEILGSPPLPIIAFCTSEAPFFRMCGIPTVLYGPGEMILAHRPNEFVRASRIVNCARIYENVIKFMQTFLE